MSRKTQKSLFNSILPAIFFGALTGILTSILVNLYKWAAKHIVAFSEQGYHFMGEKLYFVPIVLIVLCLIAFLFANIYNRVSDIRGGCIPTSIGILRGLIPFKWLLNLIGIFFMSLVSFLVGVPLGTEGPSVQMGVSIGRGNVFAFGKKHRAWDRYSMTGGACSGFAVATGAPISGILFAVEEAHQRISPMILIVASTSVMFSSITTEVLAPILGISKSLFPAMQLPTLTFKESWIPLLVGVLMGLFAVLFLNYYKVIFKFSNQTLKKVSLGWRIFGVFALTIMLGLISFSFISTGHELILELFHGKATIAMLILLLVVRSTLTLCASSNQITGGIFLPILAIGTIFSALIAKVLSLGISLDESYFALIIVLGIVACISSVMNMPLTAIVFAIEALSCYDNIVYVIITAGVAFIIVEIFGAESINDRVLDNMVAEINKGKTFTVFEKRWKVSKNSFAERMHVRDIFWPSGSFVLSCEHSTTASKNGKHTSKAIHGDDILHIRCATFDPERTCEELTAILGEDTENE